jgi:hypothetical protein
VRLSPGSYLRVVSTAEDGSGTRVMVPEVLEAQLRETAGVVELKNDAGRFTAGNTLVNGYDLKTGRPVWLIAPTPALPPPPAILTICGHDSSDATARRYGVFYADSVGSAAAGSRLP